MYFILILIISNVILLSVIQQELITFFLKDIDQYAKLTINMWVDFIPTLA